MSHLIQWIHDHGVTAVLIALGISQIASTMPSPTLTGFTSSWGYKWAFSIIHSLVAIPRIIITLFRAAWNARSFHISTGIFRHSANIHLGR